MGAESCASASSGSETTFAHCQDHATRRFSDRARKDFASLGMYFTAPGTWGTRNPSQRPDGAQLFNCPRSPDCASLHPGLLSSAPYGRGNNDGTSFFISHPSQRARWMGHTFIFRMVKC